ncbi:MAG: hypothetical protein L6R40_005174 [Gallowayella cf. fulva]|nr:MAG: hypothetical protein L6R40_005174 [Xanthomendoza cf. fulva]
MGKRFSNPIAFTPLPVTIITALVYTALFVALLVIHLVVPSAPNTPTPIAGINLTEAWQDLQYISGAFHPYNSRRNDETRDWLLRRLERILAENTKRLMFDRSRYLHDPQFRASIERQNPAVVFSDLISNTTFCSQGKELNNTSAREPGLSVYFEGTNIIVYIRGSEDGDQDWWNGGQEIPEKGGVLVNAHYDSVSTGYGASDDGVGVVSILQMIKYFTGEGHKPKRGIVALLNNGEEDYLNGAQAFRNHPVSKFPRTFLNLEGAGAGGRAVMFRSTDTEVTRAYQKSKYPFASVLSGDAFKRGIIKSETDYRVFTQRLGLRGLDLAFFEPRARYHTDQDDAKHTNIDSVWHMLSAAIPTLKALSSADQQSFRNKGSDAVWFDLFGRFLAVFKLRTLYALSIALLVVAPVILVVIGFVLYKIDKLYLLSRKKQVEHDDGDESVLLHGWKGFFQYPMLVVLASAAVIGLAFLVVKLNPYIVYSSPYAIWSMMLSAWVFVAWFVSCAADFIRPSALTRLYSLSWLFFVSWVILVGVTVVEKRQNIAGGYFLVLYCAAVFLATLVALLELFGLPRKSDYAEEVSPTNRGPNPSHRSQSISSGQRLAQSSDEQQRSENNEEQAPREEEEATETTSLLRNDRQTTFAHYHHQDPERSEEGPLDESKERKVYLGEQAWSWSLPTWLWLLEFLLLSVIPIILTGEIALFLTSSIYQTLADGSSVMLPYFAVALFTILLLIPVSPFIHRYTYHIPIFLLLVFAGTLIYNLLAFPFSANNRLKVYFDQHVDLETGINTVSLTGVKSGSYLRDIASSLPSAVGQDLICVDSTLRAGLMQCSWHGLPPRVVPSPPPQLGIPPEFGYKEWLSFSVSRTNSTRNEARITLHGKNTRACKIEFDTAISDVDIEGAMPEERLEKVPTEGSKEVRLWSRTWEKPWHVKVRWGSGVQALPLGMVKQQKRSPGLNGRVVCLWSDANGSGVIPALDEAWKFLPEWVAVSKLKDGLVEGSKRFLI